LSREDVNVLFEHATPEERDVLAAAAIAFRIYDPDDPDSRVQEAFAGETEEIVSCLRERFAESQNA